MMKERPLNQKFSRVTFPLIYMDLSTYQDKIFAVKILMFINKKIGLTVVSYCNMI